jgi:hypothetical protein
VLVTDAGSDAATAGRLALDRILRAAPGAYGTVAAAIVGGRGVDRLRTAERLHRLGVAADRVVDVPRDPALVGVRAAAPARKATRAAYLQVAALLGAAAR